jgi:hypothetical protein
MYQLTSIQEQKLTLELSLRGALHKAAHLAQSRVGLETAQGGETPSQDALRLFSEVYHLMQRAIAILPPET